MRALFLGNFGVDYSSETHHKKSLEALGHEVVALQESQASSETILEEAIKSDMFIWVHTHGWQTPGNLPMDTVLKALKRAGVPTVTYHLDLWLGLKRQADLKRDVVYKDIEHFFTVDKRMADWFNENTGVKGHYLPAGVFHEECVMLPAEKVTYEIVFVGSKRYHPEWPYRPKLINWLRHTYGSKFLHVGGDGDTGTVRGLALNQIYSNAKIAVGDSLNLGFSYPFYTSDRLWDSVGRGAFTIYPDILGLSEHFVHEKEVVYYKHGEFEDLKSKIDYYLKNDSEREAIRSQGHSRCKEEGTYIKRWQSIVETVMEHSGRV